MWVNVGYVIFGKYNEKDVDYVFAQMQSGKDDLNILEVCALLYKEEGKISM